MQKIENIRELKLYDVFKYTYAKGEKDETDTIAFVSDIDDNYVWIDDVVNITNGAELEINICVSQDRGEVSDVIF